MTASNDNPGFAERDQPERKPNAGNPIRVLGSGIYLDSPTHTHGVAIRARQDDGWLHITIDTDESIKGWALTYNGRDIPVTIERSS